MNFNLMILAADPQSAAEAQRAKIDRIFYDLEYINKAERQRGRNTVISNNNINDIPAVREVLTSSKLLVRTNPIHAYTADEVEKAISYGADILMLPMVMSYKDVEQYVNYVGDRAKVCIMIETAQAAQALARIDDILSVKGIDELFIGLNDLHISMGLPFMFELLSGGLVEYIADKCKQKNMPFGFGGIARIGDGLLPAEKILAEHVRLGSSSVILSRTFKGEVGDNAVEKIDLSEEVGKVHQSLVAISEWSKDKFTENQQNVIQTVKQIVKSYL